MAPALTEQIKLSLTTFCCRLFNVGKFLNMYRFSTISTTDLKVMKCY